MKKKVSRCYLKLKGETCIKASSPNPKDVICEDCLWNLKKNQDPNSKSLERLYNRYKKKKA
ncbi:MAG: hypothetical protein ACFFCS_06285 [Candidatus Hodarchaeota archaeon]